MIEPIGESQSALWIYKQLGERLGLGDYFQYTDEVDYLNQQLAPLGVTVSDIAEQGYWQAPAAKETGPEELQLNTPSGKIEIASETLRKAGQPAVPTWQEPLAPPDGSVLSAHRQSRPAFADEHAEQSVSAQISG